jgi:glycosyltransferase involved in cell wall biosynthesis
MFPRVLGERHRGWLEPWLQKRMMSDQCVALLAMSQYALRQFRLQNRNSPTREGLERKMEVRYPSVPLRITEPKKLSDDRLKLIFVGVAFMHKGGPALLRAHSRLKKAGVPVETTIVSSLRWSEDDFIGPPSAEYVNQQTAQLAQEGIVHYPGLPNAEVLRLMEGADFFIFPTLHDTFGYAPVEALSCATPVLASNTCAQPEIVSDGRCGFLLPFENDEQLGKWTWCNRKLEPGYLDVYEATVERLSVAITERLMACWESRDGYEAMSAAAIEQVRSRFSREQARHRLEQLYELCRKK